MLTVPLGPLAMPLQYLFLIIALLIAWGVGAAVARRGGTNPEPTLFNLFLLGVVIARIAFVVSYWQEYAGEWLRIVDIRDGGFYPWVGLLGAIGAAGLILWRRPQLRHPLGWGMVCGVAFWLLTSFSISIWQQGMQMPSVTLRDLEGRVVQLDDFAGKPMVINLWATWCPPCRREMPVLAAAQAARQDIVFLFVNQSEGPATVREFLAREDLSLENLLFDSGGQLSRHVGSRALPTTIFYDAQGRQAGHHLGELSPATLAHYLAALASASASQ